jgi:O-antigen ligase
VGSLDAPLTVAVRAYLILVVWVTVALALPPLFQARGQFPVHVSTWYFLAALFAGLVHLRSGFLLSVFLLTVTPSLHSQVNAVFGTHLVAWPYPGLDVCLGFLAAWAARWRVVTATKALSHAYPARALALLHLWITLSALLAVAHNLRQSASWLDSHGLAINLRLLRGLSWHDDFFPLQDVFVFGAAISLVLCTWSLAISTGRALVRQATACMLAGVAVNAIFAIWQKITGRGWLAHYIPAEFSVSSLWPDIHAYGAFMLVGVALALGLLRAGRCSVKERRWLVAVGGLAALGVYLSTSRFLLVVLLCALTAWFVWTAYSSSGRRRLSAVLALMVVVALANWLLIEGYRGISYGSLRAWMGELEQPNANQLFSHRPEIWGAALRMYSEFPFVGLGQGSFYRLSGIAEFSRSELLVKLGGENAHNYFLQVFAELGPLGFGLIVLALLPAFRMRGSNLSTVAFYGLAAIAVGNVFGHALLVRELLMLGALLLGLFYWEAAQVNATSLQPPASSRGLFVAGFALAVALAGIDAARSFQRFPFEYGQRCYEPRQWNDGWTSGLLMQRVPEGAHRVELQLSWPRRDLDTRPMDVLATVNDSGGTPIARTSLRAERADLRLVPVAFDLPKAAATPLTVQVRASRCYVPLNLGDAYDPRTLGLRVPSIRFLDAAGRLMPLVD